MSEHRKLFNGFPWRHSSHSTWPLAQPFASAVLFSNPFLWYIWRKLWNVVIEYCIMAADEGLRQVRRKSVGGKRVKNRFQNWMQAKTYRCVTYILVTCYSFKLNVFFLSPMHYVYVSRFVIIYSVCHSSIIYILQHSWGVIWRTLR